MEHSLYYIAYGSNLNIRQMEARCPSAKVHYVGRIPDYELVFKALGVCAYATIKPCKGVYVPVAVWRISPQDELNLDRYEGFPSHYYKKTLIVETGENTLEGMAYIMNERAVYCLPSRQCYQIVLEGYHNFGLEELVLREAIYKTDKMGMSEDNILRCYRNMYGFTQMELAVQSGVSVRNIQKYESDGHFLLNAKADTVAKLAKALKIPMEKLINKAGYSL